MTRKPNPVPPGSSKPPPPPPPPESGMTLRDYFAGQALAGIVTDGIPTIVNAKLYAAAAYGMADAMLLARATVVDAE